MRLKPFLFFFFLSTQFFTLSAQDPIEFNSEDSLIISKRWAKLQPKVVVSLTSGDAIEGQAIHFDMERLLILPSMAMPLELEDQAVSIPIENILGVVLDRGGRSTMALTSGIASGTVGGIALGLAVGGPVGAIILGNLGGVGLGLAAKGIHEGQTHAELELKDYNLNYNEECLKLQKWSVFEDSLILTEAISDLPDHSRAIRSVFQPKHFRISFGISTGFCDLEDDVYDALESAGLPGPIDSWHNNMGFEFIDFAWRFKNRWIVGGGMLQYRNDMVAIQYYTSNWESVGIQNYNYRVNQTDFRVYAEYAPWPIEWFPVKRTEILFGGGLIVSRADSHFSYDYLHDSLSWDNTYFGIDERKTIFGIQARASAHVYLTQNISLSLGLEGNLYQDLESPVVSLPENDPAMPDEFSLPSLNYSTVRIKLGAHISF